MTNKKTFMRIDEDLLKEIRKRKVTKRESYAEVVERLLKREAKKL
jgi:predicted CopG family antitoxin